MAKPHLSFFVALALALAPAARAADTTLLPGNAAQGEKLHAAQCVGCHGTEVYTRNDRRVESAAGLVKQVEFCNQQLRKKLSREQINDLIAYLNETYYRFE